MRTLPIPPPILEDAINTATYARSLRVPRPRFTPHAVRRRFQPTFFSQTEAEVPFSLHGEKTLSSRNAFATHGPLQLQDSNGITVSFVAV
jgi:hypothetical protein